MKEERGVIAGMPGLVHGSDYNPEQWIKWKETVWEEDMRLAKLAGLNSLSVGIFSWSMLEPAEGEFHFEWLDEVMDMMAANGLKAVLATPSAARPAWMAQKYPEVLRTPENRVRNLFGQRHNHCMSSPVYREKTRRINTELAKRYQNHPALGMWHISNEVSGECHCRLCQERFRKWLQEKYHTLDALNEAWWSTFWSHRYTAWEQIESPSRHGEHSMHGLVLDWRRFVTELHMDFLENEMAPLKQYTPRIPRTTNLMATYDELDYNRFARIFDIVSWDNYPGWRGESGYDTETACRTGFYHDLMYGLKGQPFFIMESCPSAVNWRQYNKLLRPGTHLLQSVQGIAHGSDSVSYFQFRKSRGSSEKMHGAVVDHEGSENTRVFGEVAQTGKVLSCLSVVAGARKEARVALIHDYQNGWGLDNLQGGILENQNYMRTLLEHYRIFWERGIAVDVVDETCSLEGYDLVAAPMTYMIRENFAENIKNFTAKGGTVVFTYLSGYVNDTDLCFLGGFPGPLREVLGIWAEELDSLYPEDKNAVEWGGCSYEAYDFCELIHAEGAQVLGTYEKDFYKGMPALTCNDYGKGKAYYIAARTGPELLRRLYGRILKEKRIEPPVTLALPEGVSFQSRADKGAVYGFLMNFTSEEKAAELQGETVLLPPRGTKVFIRPFAGEHAAEAKLRFLI